MTQDDIVRPAALHRVLVWQVTLLIAGAVLVVVGPEAALLFTLCIWALVGLYAAPPDITIGAPLAVLLIIPADHIAGLNAARLGFFIFGASVLLVIASIPHRITTKSLKLDWDLYGLVGVLIASTIVNSRSGELRGLLFWAAAGLTLLWLRQKSVSAAAPVRQIVTAIAIAGSIGGAVALLAYVTGWDPSALLPGYRPHNLEFSSFVGTRGVGLSGHPLRLGTITMLSAIVAFSWAIEEGTYGRHRLKTYLVLSLSLAGLVLSGARGAWLSLLIALLAIGVLKFWERDFSRFARMGVLAGAICVTVSVTGLSGLIYERLFGSAVHVGSLAQRLQALQAVAAYWKNIPVFGLGFGGAAEITSRAGLEVPNLENEYLRFFIAAGVVGPLALLLLGSHRLVRNLQRAPSGGRTLAHGLLIAIFADAATYNLFSWSAGPCLLVALTYLAFPGDSELSSS